MTQSVLDRHSHAATNHAGFMIKKQGNGHRIRLTDAFGIPIAAIFDEDSKDGFFKVHKSYGNNKGRKGGTTRYVFLKPRGFVKKQKKIDKKEVFELLNKLPEDTARHYIRLMKMEVRMGKKK